MLIFAFILTFYLPLPSYCIPVLSADDQKLNSIVISEIDFTTEQPLIIADTEIVVVEPEKSFNELIERYDEMFIKSQAGDVQNVKKRNSDVTEEDINNKVVEEGGKSLIEKVEIEDPDVRKEFEIEISKQSSDAVLVEEEETTDTSQILETEYDPNYARKIPENATKLTTHEKENLQVHLVEQLVNHDKENLEYTTILPEESLANHELVKDPVVIEALEHINYESGDELKAHEHTTMVNVVHMDIDPIEIIPKDRHRLARTEVDANDKLEGFVGIPSDDLDEPGMEVTEADHYFTDNNTKKEKNPSVSDFVNAEVGVIREALEIIAIYGKSLKIEVNNKEATDLLQDETTIAPEVEEATKAKPETFEIQLPKHKHVTYKSSDISSEEEKSSESIQNKSSEEEEGSGSGEKVKKIAVDSSGSSEENEESPQRLNSLTEEIFKESTGHEIKKKDHPDGIALPVVAIQRKFSDDTSRQFDDGSLIPDLIDAKTQATITAIYETVEDVFTTLSDGIKLSNELRQNVNSFRGDSKESSSVLDTLREAISSKNSKNPLVVFEVAENRQLNGDNREMNVSMMAVVTIIAFVSMVVLIGLFSVLKRRSESFYFI